MKKRVFKKFETKEDAEGFVRMHRTLNPQIQWYNIWLCWLVWYNCV